MNVLILGGTTEASALARVLSTRLDISVTTSFAGRTADPRAVAGETRVGGFGGAEGLADHLRADRVDVVIDATHPFAARMRWNAFEACEATGVPLVRVERPPWDRVEGDRWTSVPDLATAADAVAGYQRVFLTTGRTELSPFARCDGTWFLVRSIEPPDPMPLPTATVILGRGPFSVAEERALLIEHRIEIVVTKDSGGGAAGAKLEAARELEIPVVVVDRPPNPPGPLVRSVDDALAWLAPFVDRPPAGSVSGAQSG